MSCVSSDSFSRGQNNNTLHRSQGITQRTLSALVKNRRRIVTCLVFDVLYWASRDEVDPVYCLQKAGEALEVVFTISKVSCRAFQRPRRVMGDAGSSVNSAGGWAWDVITRCSLWQHSGAWAVPNALYLPNNPAGSSYLGEMWSHPPTRAHRHRDTYPAYPPGPCDPRRTRK